MIGKKKNSIYIKIGKTRQAQIENQRGSLSCKKAQTMEKKLQEQWRGVLAFAPKWRGRWSIYGSRAVPQASEMKYNSRLTLLGVSTSLLPTLATSTIGGVVSQR